MYVSSSVVGRWRGNTEVGYLAGVILRRRGEERLLPTEEETPHFFLFVQNQLLEFVPFVLSQIEADTYGIVGA